MAVNSQMDSQMLRIFLFSTMVALTTLLLRSLYASLIEDRRAKPADVARWEDEGGAPRGAT